MIRSIITLGVVACLVAASSVQACSVPVFRYALEQWRPDNFEVIVFHQGPLSDAEKDLAAKVEPKNIDASYTANAWVRLVDLEASPEPAILELWEQQKSETLPWMLVRSPAKFGKPLNVISQEFNEENVTSLLDSPLRKKITESILKGDSVVWILLKSGDKTKDAAAEEIMQGELKRLQSELKLPEIDEQDIQDGFLSVDPDELKLRFSMISVARDDPQEQAFVQMLLTVEPDLRDPEFANDPMALPVFGRGRVLYALIGKGINAETIEDASRFLTGACQCTVKAQNPGVDLLTSVNWDSLVVPTLEKDTILPALTGLSGFGKDDGDGHLHPDGHSQGDDHAEAVASNEGEADETSMSASSHEAGSATATANPPAVSVGKLAIYVVGGLALLVVGMSVVFAPKPS
ncbi:MAG: hypothetical protein O2983_10580 [Planctomycetota bacterium]|nr:hypothetical protein [Planctomycetota bacterium]MDA0918534.1 hypothetical protein [Planctomycetota bacterium]MDA1160045.1 hypothetical protein [Planctomycetota bacterium]